MTQLTENAEFIHQDAHSDAPLLEARGMTISYGDFMAVKDADLVVRAGERVALVGESGSGKTTVAMALAGMLADPSASVVADVINFQGTPVRQPSGPLPQSVPGVSMAFQDAMTSLDPTWRVGGQLSAVLRSRGGLSRRDAEAAAAAWLERVGFADPERVMRARPYELSGGMRQRVMLAIALSGSPRLLVADEPTSALDATLARMTMDLLKELTEESGAALLIVTHDLRLCLEYADTVCVMRGGSIVETAPAAGLERNAKHPYTRGLLECVPTLDSVGFELLPTLDKVMAEAAVEERQLSEVAS